MRRGLVLFSLLLLLAAGCGSQEVGEAPDFIDTGIDPDSWAVVPAGEFLLGLHNHETLVDYDYEIGVTNVTNSQFAAYLNEALAAGDIKIVGEEIVGYYPGDRFDAFKHEERIDAGDYSHMPLDEQGLRLDYDGQTFTAKSGYENHPVVHVTWFGAKGFCDFNGWRLPTEIEWEKAARGTDDRPFPWGDEIERNNANFYSSRDLFEKIGKKGDTTPVGFYNGQTYDGYETLDSPSPYGAYDMAGNVWQWTNDDYEDQHYRYLRGGSNATYEYNLRVWTRNSAGPEYSSPSAGFRCVRDS